jgi:hypothetical protein
MVLTKSECAKIGSQKSREVSALKRQTNINIYNKYPILCKQCNSPIDYDHKNNIFCSHECAAIFNNHKRPKKQIIKRQYVPRSDIEKQRRNNISVKRNKNKRQYLLNHIGNTCNICNFNHRLRIHKKDGNRHKDFREMNWKELNDIITNHIDEYVTVCHKCHSHIHWCMKFLNLNYDNIKDIIKRNNEPQKIHQKRTRIDNPSSCFGKFSRQSTTCQYCCITESCISEQLDGCHI